MPADRLVPRTFPASHRLKNGGDFARARVNGRRVVQGCLILNWVGAPERAHSRLGVITSRKVGIAVIRSRSRRLLREAYRVHQTCLTRPVDVVLVARPSIAGKSQQSVNLDYLAALRRAGLVRSPEPDGPAGGSGPAGPASPDPGHRGAGSAAGQQ